MNIDSLAAKASEIKTAQDSWNPRSEPEETQSYTQTETDRWAYAEAHFPKVPFPWHVLPGGLSESYKKLARSFSTSAIAIVGAAMAIFASVLGATVSVAPKGSWKEPFILWLADIRNSGDGKTPSARALCEPLYKAQAAADKLYEQQKELYEQGIGSKPDRPRGYFSTDLTIPGLRNDISGHGGTVYIMDELSAFINSQNSNKKGTDREAWLALHDGNPIRVLRGNIVYSLNPQVSLSGGIQPQTWVQSFRSKDGIYLKDGTIYRFLATIEEPSLYLLTNETWSGKAQEIWEDTLIKAMTWADIRVSIENWSPLILWLDEEAQEIFFTWANELKSRKNLLPDIIKGYLPKDIGYALRLSGVLYCMKCFEQNEEPVGPLTGQDILKGIELSMFYMGHISQACKVLLGMDTKSANISEQDVVLAKSLESLKTNLDMGRLSIGIIYDEFNNICPEPLKLTSPKAMGQILRYHKLTVSTGKTRVNGKSGVRYLKWDTSTDDFIAKALKPVEDRKKTEADHVDEEICNLNLSDTEYLVDLDDIRKSTLSAVDACISSSGGLGGHCEAQISDLTQVAQIETVKEVPNGY
jgi:hypothetical protein